MSKEWKPSSLSHRMARMVFIIGIGSLGALNSAYAATCANPEPVTLPLVINGAGDFCRVATGSISEVNSWNTDLVDINGVALTNSYQNQWSKNMPAKGDGKYVIRYVGKYPWSHLDVKGSNSSSASSGSGSSNTQNANAGSNNSTTDTFGRFRCNCNGER